MNTKSPRPGRPLLPDRSLRERRSEEPVSRIPWSRRPWVRQALVALAAALLSPVIALVSLRVEAELPNGRGSAAPAATAQPPGRVPIEVDLAQSAPSRWQIDAQGRVVLPLASGRRAVLSVDARLQHRVEEVLDNHAVRKAALVALEPSSGRVLAWISRSPRADDLTRAVEAPAASVFKLVTAAALLDRGIDTDERTCYHGGTRGITARHLKPNPRLDTRCRTLAQALGHSTNCVFAKLALAHLSPALLGEKATQLGFGRAPLFDIPTPPSPAEMPHETLEFARTAAGFWHTSLSPVHGALLAAAIANRGVAKPARAITAIEEAPMATGSPALVEPWQPLNPVAAQRMMKAEHAERLAEMMAVTVESGTAKAAFHDRRRRPYLRGIRVAGKTGSLTRQNPYRAYSWWVGFAPVDKPQIAVAALIINDPQWRIKGSTLAREALSFWLVERPKAIAAGRWHPLEKRTAGRVAAAKARAAGEL